MEMVGDPDDFIFVEAGSPFAEPADIDLNGIGADQAEVGIQIGVFIGDPLLSPVGEELDEFGKRGLSIVDSVFRDHPIESRIEEVGFFLDEEFIIIEVDRMVDAQLVDEVECFVEVFGFVEMEVDEAGLFWKNFIGEFIAEEVFIELSKFFGSIEGPEGSF